MPQTLKATPEKYLIVVVQMQCKATISKCLPEILLGHVQNSVETHILNCLGVYLFSKPVCNPFFFCSFSHHKQGYLFPLLLPLSFSFFLTIDFCTLTSTKSREGGFDYKLIVWAVLLLLEMNLSWLRSRTCFL